MISDIVKDKLCLGCGLCEAVCGKESVVMQLQEDGFYIPAVKKHNPEKERLIERICPGVNVVNDIEIEDKETVWGKIEKLYSGYSKAADVRKRGSSGGIISSIAIYLLESNTVDAVLQVGGDRYDYQRNSLRVSRSRTDVLACASSRYAPALIFDKIIELLASSEDTYCFIGKPCDISGLKNFLKEYPQFVNRFKFTVSIVCAGMPSYAGTKKIIADFKAIEPVKDLLYRGNGWPGFFSFTDSNSDTFKMSYNDSWGKKLGKFVHFRCKICPDGIGLQADIAVGDAWETLDGYPDFSEKEGQSLIIARTAEGVNMMARMEREGLVGISDLDIEKLRIMQPYQYDRRTRVGARLLAYSLIKRRFVNYKNVKLLKNALKSPKKILLKEFLGTIKRLLK